MQCPQQLKFYCLTQKIFENNINNELNLSSANAVVYSHV